MNAWNDKKLTGPIPVSMQDGFRTLAINASQTHIDTIKRVDIELRLCGFPGSSQYFEFQAVTSFGQEFVMDELELRACGEARMKLCVVKESEALEVMRRMAADGLNVKQINTELVP